MSAVSMPEPKLYHVWRRMRGTQTYIVQATSKAEARRLVLEGKAEAVDFNITGAESGMQIEEAGS